MGNPIRVLLVEDSEDDAVLVSRTLLRAGYEPWFKRVESLDEMRSALDGHEWDIVISDYVLPSFSGPEALDVLRVRGLDLPFICVPGTIGEDTAVQVMKMGAHDYIMKDNMRRLVPAIERELRDAAMRREHKHAEADRTWLLSVVEASLNEIYVFDAETLCFRYVSPGVLRHLGHTREEIAQKTLLDVQRGFDAAAYAALVADVLAQTRDKLVYETTHHGADGTTYPVEVHLQLIERHGTKAFLAIVLDITERRHAEEARSRLAAIVESSEDAVIGETLDGRIVTWNRGAERLYGYSADEAIGRPVSILAPPDRAVEVDTILDRIKAGVPVEPFETVRVRNDGQQIHVSLSISPIKGSAGEIIGAAAIARDMTERKHAEDELREHALELARSNTELEEFAYVASHDLQEPLRMVSSYVQLLEKRYGDRLDEDARKFMFFAVDGAQRMQSMVSDLLTYSRVGRREESLAPIDCGEVFETVRSQLERTIEESGAVLTSGALPFVHGRRTQLVQLLQNLVGNAIKYRGDAPPRIHVASELNGREWVFSVQDNGMGIEPRHRDRIFRIFQRLHERDKYPGSGIGLAIAKKIAERHGGRLWVESEPGTGSTFLFSIPVKAR